MNKMMTMTMTRVGLAVKLLCWGSNYNLLGVNTVREVFILRSVLYCTQ